MSSIVIENEEEIDIVVNDEISNGDENLISKSSEKITKIPRFIIMLLAFLLPIWFLPIEGFSLMFSKSLLISTLILTATIFYLIHLLQDGRVRIPKSFAMFSLCALMLFALTSSLFSGLISFSLFGNASETGTFFTLFLMFVAFFITSQLFLSEKHVSNFFIFVIFSSLVVFVLQLFQSLFGLSLGNILVAKTDSLIGSWNELGIFFGFIALISIIFLEFFDKESERFFWRRLLLFVSLGISLLTMIFVNFTATWFVFSACLIVLFVYLLFSFANTRDFLRLSLFVILLSLFFILGQSLVGDMINSVGLSSLEVRPSWSATFQVVKETLSSGVKNLLLGSGPNTFVFDWLKYKPLDINQTLFWATRFQTGIGLLPSSVAMIGVLGSLAWLGFLLVFLYHGLRSINQKIEDSNIKSLLFATFFGSVYLWVFTIIYIPGHFLLTLTFLVTGLFFAMLVKVGRLKLREFVFVKNSTFGFASALLVVFLLIGSITTSYLFFQKYWASYSYAKGLTFFNVQGDLEKAEEQFVKAIRFDKQDRYYRALSELGLVRLSLLVNQQKELASEELMLQLQNILAFSIQNAQNATNINSSDPLNWMALGRVYENVIPLQIEGARGVALDSYAKALESSPFDPRALLASARVEIQSGNNDEAKEFLESSLSLKGNYTPALFLLARIAAQEGDLDRAISQTELARLTAPNDVGVLFQLGLLYYQKEDYKKAQEVLERTVTVNPEYSNARYFLGLSYDNNDERQKAIDQFELIEKLNPENTEVERILTNLRARRGALQDISPPEPAPEEREELPIEEGE